ncbi:Hsp20/alpha crystallin family protein [Thermoanaerobacterium sp. RBIITD]|uniref:Hsp20/alpha crystallin family protein n=1 Tax=Thermoanaerobacterium sp. RBIITD TaxID=1550240 RepID=UPI000BB6D751|nr:Hsp20/alpha crystallin family protein [Thermoanaerobacterium sp. RBIITD]SNX53922.1 HSP20 family protein [Thermoanaerobacterium sp. RBIITD]
MSLIKWHCNELWPDFNFDFNLPAFSNMFVRPKIDITESDTEVTATAELPGVDKKDIEINVHDNVLEIKGQTSKVAEKKNQNYYLNERYYGSFERRVGLPSEVDSERTTAKFENGILTIVMPKLHPEKQKGRRIDIQ